MCFVTLVTASPIAPIYPGYGFAAPAVVHAGPVVHAPVLAHAPLIAKHVVHEPVDPNPHYRQEENLAFFYQLTIIFRMIFRFH